MAEKSHKKKKKRSIIKERHLLLRVLRYLTPYRGAIASGLLFAFLSSFLGAASLLPFIPIINHVVDPKATALREEHAERKRVKQEKRLSLLIELEGLREELNQESPGLGEDLERSRVWKEKVAELEAETRQLGLDDEEDESAMSALDPQKQLSVLIDRFKTENPYFTKANLWLSNKKNKAKEEILEFLEAQQEGAIKIIALMIVIAAAMKALLEYQAKFRMTSVVYRATQKLKLDLYSSCLDLDFQTLRQRSSGNLIARLSSDVSKVRLILQATLQQSITVPFQIFFLFLLLLILSFKVTMITVFALPGVVIPITMLSKKLRQLAKKDAEEDAYLVDVMQETIQGMEVVKAFASEKRERRRFRRVSRGQVKRQIRRQRLSLAAPALSDVLTVAAMALVIVVGAYIVMNGEMNAGEFAVYLIALTRFYKPMKGIANGMMKVQSGLASAERVFEIIDAKPAIVEKPNAAALPELREAITFEDVTFGYGIKRADVLTNFSLVIPKGKRYALVGLSGAGKSTVTKLIPRFYDPQEGSVKIDGVDLRDITFASMRRQIAIVTQETILFDSTVYDNIAYGRPSASRDEVEAAARAANAHDFIEALPQGYATRIGERGGQLSGGQRQRLAIARAILRNAPILILDEATSALDNESEALVKQALERLMQDRTVLVIAHRLSTIQNADQIVVMEKGAAVEQGTHEELLARGGRYAEFCHVEPSGELVTTPVPEEETIVVTEE